MPVFLFASAKTTYRTASPRAPFVDISDLPLSFSDISNVPFSLLHPNCAREQSCQWTVVSGQGSATREEKRLTRACSARVSRPRRLPDCRSPESIPPIPPRGQTLFVSENSERFFLTLAAGSRIIRCVYLLMAGGTTQAMMAPAVRRERHDTLQRTVWGFFMPRRIRDRGFSPRPGRNGPNQFLTPSPDRMSRNGF
jgi:hypothetical protein